MSAATAGSPVGVHGSLTYRFSSSVSISIFSVLLQKQTAPTLSSSPRGKTLCCFRRRRRRVSHTPLSFGLSQLLSHLIRPLHPLRLPAPSLPLHLSRLSLFLCPSVISPMICPRLSPSLCLPLSLHLLATLFQVGHCLRVFEIYSAYAAFKRLRAAV